MTDLVETITSHLILGLIVIVIAAAVLKLLVGICLKAIIFLVKKIADKVVARSRNRINPPG